MNRKVCSEKNLIIVAAVLFAAAMAVFPAVTETGAKSAITIWINSVVPVLLPFFIFADFIKRTADMERIPTSAYPFIAAFLSGYPMGAKAVGDMVSTGVISKEKGLHILSYSLVTGPAFILGTVGTFLGNSQAAAIAAAAHYFGAVLNGFFWHSNTEHSAKIVDCGNHVRKGKKKGWYESFNDSILSGFRTMAVILAYLIVFMIGADMLQSLGLLNILPDETWRGFAKGLMEMTIGTCAVGMCNINMGLKTVLTAFLISFGGMSVIGQSLSVSGGGWLKTGELLKIKLTHGLLAGIVAAFIIISGNIFFPGKFPI